MIQDLFSGLVLGATAGLSPGPLQTLVICQTLRHDFSAGVKVSVAPLLSDLPIILISVFVFSRIPDTNPVLGAISLGGAVLLFHLARQVFRTAGISPDLMPGSPASLGNAVLTNLLNPHPYLFWFLVGAPTVMRSADKGPGGPLLFVLSFYTVLVSAFLLVALLASRSRSFLTGNGYRWVMRGLGLLLAGFACLFLYNAVAFFLK